jgi:sulfite exporter TauE/SafE
MSRLFARVQSQLGKQWARDQDDRNDQDDRDDRYGVTKPGLASPFGLGLLNGLLPCGLVWAALAAATALGSASQGALFMLVFGLGTIPTLFATATLGRLVGSRTRRRLAQAVPAALVVLGLLLVARGLLLPAYGSSHGHHKAPADNAVSHSAMSHSTPTGGAVS